MDFQGMLGGSYQSQAAIADCELVHMLPSLPLPDTVDVGIVDSVMPSEPCMGHWAGPDFSHVLLSKLRLLGPLPVGHPSLLGSILHVVGVGPEKEMLWVDAGFDIAMVADHNSFREVLSFDTLLESSSEAMGQPSFVIIPECSVAVIEEAALPQPTFTRLPYGNTRPEDGNPLCVGQLPSSHQGISDAV